MHPTRSPVSISAIAAVVAFATAASAGGPVFTLEPTTLQAAPGQAIDLVVSSGAPVNGIMLGLEIGNQDLVADEPVFMGVDFSPSPFDDVPGAFVEGNNGPDATNPQFIDAWILSADPADTFTLNGVVARVIIDASGFSPGAQFPLHWSWSAANPGSAETFVIDANDNEIVFNGASVMLTIVPEPGSASLAAFAAFLAARSRRARPN